MIRISFKPDFIRVGDFISTAVVLYGPNFSKFLDLGEQYFEVTDIVIARQGKKTQLDYSETVPKDQQVRIPINIMSRVADKLAKKRKEVAAVSGQIKRKASSPSLKKDQTYLQVLSALPTDKAKKAAQEASITISFNEILEKESVSHDSFFLITASGKEKNRKVPGQLSVIGQKISFKPLKKLQPDTLYQVVLSNHIRSKSSHRLNKTATWIFRTKTKIAKAKLFGPEKQYLKVLVVSPRVRALNTLTDTTIELRLSGVIVPESVNDQSFYLSSKGRKVKSDLVISKDRITLKPKQRLKEGTVYTVDATIGIRDTTGNGLKKQVRWQFKTRQSIQYPEADDSNILIFSPTHEPVSYVKKKQGVLKIGITAFSSLLHADINGKRVPIKKDTQVEFNIPYRLRSKTTSFEITTFTKEGKASKKFVIHYGNKPKPRKPPFLLITILSATHVDNLNNSPADSDDIEAASKATLIIVPQFELRVRNPSIVRFKGIILRDKHADEENKGRETSYSQFAIEWEERKTFLGTFIAGIGWNFIRMINSDFIGENEISEETFFSTKIKNRVSKTGKWQVGLEYKNKNATEDASDIDEETDGSEITLSGSANFGLASLKNKTKASVAVNDAIGKYQDYSSASAKYKVLLPLGDFTPSLGYTYKYKQMTIFNPSEDAKPEYTSGTLSAKLKYKLFSKTFISLEYKNKNQVSNLETSTYTTNTATMSMMQIF